VQNKTEGTKLLARSTLLSTNSLPVQNKVDINAFVEHRMTGGTYLRYRLLSDGFKSENEALGFKRFSTGKCVQHSGMASHWRFCGKTTLTQHPTSVGKEMGRVWWGCFSVKSNLKYGAAHSKQIYAHYAPSQQTHA